MKKAAYIANKTVMFAFILVQLWISVLLTVGTFGVLPFVVFGLWGLVNAFALFSSSVLARKSALAWHAIVVGFILVNWGFRTLVPTGDLPFLLTVSN